MKYSDLTPADYLFAIHENDGDDLPEAERYWVAVNPIPFWKKEGCLYDQHVSSDAVRDALESVGLSEAMEGGWELKRWNGVHMDSTQARAKLLAAGFQEDQSFTRFMQEEN